jgi:hypothetical protein
MEARIIEEMEPVTIHVGAARNGRPGDLTIEGETFEYQGISPEGEFVWWTASGRPLTLNPHEEFVSDVYLN